MYLGTWLRKCVSEYIVELIGEFPMFFTVLTDIQIMTLKNKILHWKESQRE